MDSYLHNKRRKLETQWKQRHDYSSSSSSSSSSRLFTGVKAWLDGLVPVPLLTHTLSQHGGIAILTPSSSMTHIIVDASRFNAAHARTSKHWNRPIVDFRWITDSDKQTKLLDVEQYLVNAAAAAAAGEKGNSSKDPNFVQNFFQSSRLHFLGSWKDHYEKIYEKDLKKIVPRFDFEKQRKLAMQFGKPGSRVYRRVAHIDMDSFFASVSIRDDPSLVGKPVAISHSVTPSTNSTGEVSSANYVARQYGIHAGMYLKKALEACPHLIILPYEFEKYQEVSEQIYSIFFSYTHRVEALSCDEALLEFFFEEDLDCDTVEKDLNLVNEIRMEIFKQTRCTASVGLSHNILLARIATAKAKPNGSFFFRQDNSFQALSDLSVDEIPGVGWHTCQVMEEMKILKCSDLQKLSFSELEKSFGEKKARALYQYSRGIDDRELNLTVERKSIGVDVGWGVRFENEKEVEQFLIELSKELSKKLIAANRSAISLTFKIKERAEGAPEPKKYLGHGICNNRSKSVKLPSPLINHQDIFNVIHALYKEMRLDPIMIRALGITASKLEHNQGSEKEPHIMNYFSKQNQVQNESSKSIQPLSNMRIENRQSANQPKRRNSILSFFKSEKHQPSSQENSTLSVASFANPQLFIEQFSSAVDPSILKELPFFVRQQLRIDKAYLKLNDKGCKSMLESNIEVEQSAKKCLDELTNTEKISLCLSNQDLVDLVQTHTSEELVCVLFIQFELGNIDAVNLALKYLIRKSKTQRNQHFILKTTELCDAYNSFCAYFYGGRSALNTSKLLEHNL